MSAVERFPLTFRSTRRPLVVVLVTFLGVLLFHLITLQRGGGGEFGVVQRSGWLGYLRYLLGYYLLLELVSVAILMAFLRGYTRVLRIRSAEASARGILRFQAQVIPALLLSIVVFAPVTNALRYLLTYYPNYAWNTYFPEYFFTPYMYLNYLVPILVFGLGLLNFNLLLDYSDWNRRRFETLAADREPAPTAPTGTHLQTLDVQDEQGQTLLPVDEVLFFEVEAKTYFAHTQGRAYQHRKTLADLEAELDPTQFFRVNRSVIVNLKYFKNFSYWEHDKYILRLVDGRTEFVMQRARLRELKQRLKRVAI